MCSLVANNFTDIDQLEALNIHKLKFWTDVIKEIVKSNEKHMKKITK